MNRFYNPVSIYFGNDSLGECTADLKERFSHIRRVLILTRGGGVEATESLAPILSLFAGKEGRFLEAAFYNPNIKDIYNLLQQVDSFPYELIVAIGGGSVMDSAKALTALQHMEISTPADIREVIMGEKYAEKSSFTPWIGLPTTSGTGSEVTSWATVWDEELGCKYSVADRRLFAKAAIILPELTLTMPLRLSVATGLDALCHATEAYWSVQSNPFSRAFALQAIERIRAWLPRLKREPSDLARREQLSLGSVLAGLAFSNTKTTACHSISYPLTLLYGIDHGIAASLTLSSVLRHNYSKIVEPEKLLRAFGAEDADGVDRFLRTVYEMYDLPGNLGAYGVTKESIPMIVSHAYTKGRMDNNPVPIKAEELDLMLASLL
ncbi:phosphonoacetaldehyde reductase [Paenibacillus luteus]|uniref:phosphonoacetaldehyde reductase n=1 Tax=Paenibacillus luteus TaxID=2545753 RepID=UPI001144AF9A|nr:phosphonoacetaldehyde reductase [Paenibacillus luteus]